MNDPDLLELLLTGGSHQQMKPRIPSSILPSVWWSTVSSLPSHEPLPISFGIHLHVCYSRVHVRPNLLLGQRPQVRVQA